MVDGAFAHMAPDTNAAFAAGKAAYGAPSVTAAGKSSARVDTGLPIPQQTPPQQAPAGTSARPLRYKSYDGM